MTRLHLVLIVAVAALMLAIAGTASAAATPRLDGTVGPGFTITLKTKAGAKVSKLKPGKYQIVVKDQSSIHNFHLTGSGVNKDSGISSTGTKTWTVTLRKGTYIFVCDPHASSMKGKFTVA